jgi:hypothetical protein
VTLSRGESRGDWRDDVGGGRVCCVVDVGEVGLGANLLYVPLTALLYQLREKQRLEPWRHDVGLDGRGRNDCEVVVKDERLRFLSIDVVVVFCFGVGRGKKNRRRRKTRKLEGCLGRWMLIEAVTQQPSWVSLV